MESLIDLFQAKTTTKEFKSSTISFKLRTLTTDELIDVLRRADLLSTSEPTKVFIAKKITLAYALEAVNGVEILAVPEVNKLRENTKDAPISKVDAVLTILGSFDADVIDSLYACYNSLVLENEKKREELKKGLVAR